MYTKVTRYVLWFQTLVHEHVFCPYGYSSPPPETLQSVVHLGFQYPSQFWSVACVCQFIIPVTFGFFSTSSVHFFCDVIILVPSAICSSTGTILMTKTPVYSQLFKEQQRGVPKKRYVLLFSLSYSTQDVVLVVLAGFHINFFSVSIMFSSVI